MNCSNQSGEVCGICNRIAQRKCSACKAISYCSREHQKFHWKQHINHCIPFKITEDFILGRHLIATRKINIGEIILTEIEPLISAPLNNTCPLCLNCFSLLEVFDAHPCEKCGWPLCNNCKVHGSECEFTIKHREAKVSINDFGVPHPTYKCIGVVRALALRDIDPARYKKFINLESHCQYHDDNDNDNDNNENDKNIDYKKKNQTIRIKEFVEIARFVKRFFKLDDNIKLNEIVRILGILQINGHEIPTTENPHMAVYDCASFFEHNCHANCSKSFTENGGIVIRAALPILKGQHLTLCYTDPLWGVTNRRHHLLETKFFECTCDRCRDPTEFGTMFNALKCTNGSCDGSSLPSTFISMNSNDKYVSKKSPDYICSKCHETTMTWNNAEIILENIGIELAVMKKNNINACREFIKRNSKIIHNNHYYMIDVESAYVQLIGQENGGLSIVNDDLLSEKISICKKLNQLLRTLVPAENRIRGLILFEMHAGLVEYAKRQTKNELRRSILMVSRDALTEAYELLRYEPEILPEGKMARVAQQNLHEMDKIISTLCRNEL